MISAKIAFDDPSVAYRSEYRPQILGLVRRKHRVLTSILGKSGWKLEYRPRYFASRPCGKEFRPRYYDFQEIKKFLPLHERRREFGKGEVTMASYQQWQHTTAFCGESQSG